MRLAARQADREGLVSRTDPLDDVPELIAHLPAAGGVAWIREGEGFIGWGEAARVRVGTGPGRFQRAAAAVEELLSTADVCNAVGGWGTGPLAFGSFAFDADSAASAVAIPAVVIGVAGGRAWVTRTSSPGGRGAAGTEAGEPEFPAQAPAGAVPRRAPPRGAPQGAGSSQGAGYFKPLDEASFIRAVEAARDAIRKGRLDKVVLSLQVVATSASSFDQRAVLARLAAEYPQCYTFAFDSFVGASPELLVRREGRDLRSQPLAGSSRRGESPEEDAALGAALAASPKDRWEHDLAVVTVVEALHPLCCTLRIDPEPSLLRLANVQHLATEVVGELSGDPVPDALSIAGAVHPTAAVCGTPSRKALALIRELEGPNRGRYAGPVGWVDANGNGEWAIALRCAELSGTTARLFAGCGIVEQSDPGAELEEARLKLRPVRSALGIA
ncbi:MAG TPA: isochorismate synthase [Actinomycetota bacterium]|nr:isochorismate synthase [Actinomycetota bacterium]